MRSSFFECPFADGGKGVINVDPNTVRHGRIAETPCKLPRSSSSYSATHCVPMLHCPLLDRVLGRLKVRVFPFRGRRQPNHRLGVQVQLDPFRPPPIIFHLKAGVDVDIYMVGI